MAKTIAWDKKSAYRMSNAVVEERVDRGNGLTQKEQREKKGPNTHTTGIFKCPRRQHTIQEQGLCRRVLPQTCFVAVVELPESGDDAVTVIVRDAVDAVCTIERLGRDNI